MTTAPNGELRRQDFHLSVPWLVSLHSLPRVPWDVGSPPSSVLCSATTANGPPRGRSVLPLLPRSLGSRLWLCVPWSRKAHVRGRRLLSTPGVLPSLGGTPAPDLSPRRPLALPSSRVTPVNACPALRPRWCPGHAPWRLQDCCLPATAHRSACPRYRLEDYPVDHDSTYFGAQ